MAKKRATSSAKRKSRAAKPSSDRAKKRAAEKAFMKSLVAHGQAVRLPKDAKLPPGATHEIVEDSHGKTKVVRRRFSAF